MKEIVQDFFKDNKDDQEKTQKNTITKAITENPAASAKRKMKDQDQTDDNLPKKINFIEDDIDLTTRKTSALNIDNHNRIRLLSELYNIPMSKIENNIINNFFEKHKDLLNEELNKKKNGF